MPEPTPRKVFRLRNHNPIIISGARTGTIFCFWIAIGCNQGCGFGSIWSRIQFLSGSGFALPPPLSRVRNPHLPLCRFYHILELK